MAAADRDGPRIALVGNPNSGKSTLFNALTGKRARTGNIGGVTVGRAEARIFTPHGKPVVIWDLPGVYSLSPRSPDEVVTRDALLGAGGVAAPDAVVCVVDASQLERHLYLVTQLMDLGKPVLVALNKVDVAERLGLRIDVASLAADLGVPVMPVRADVGKGVTELKQRLTDLATHALPGERWGIPAGMQSVVTRLEAICHEHKVGQAAAQALLLLGDAAYRRGEGASWVPDVVRDRAQALADEVQATGTPPETQLAQARYGYVRRVCKRAGADGGTMAPWSDSMDRVALHPVVGPILMTGIFCLLFLAIFKWATLPMDILDVTFGWLADQVRLRMPSGVFRDLLTDGVVAGVGGVVIFLPQIVILFFLIRVLEGSGYLARAAFLMNRVMGMVGLNGKAFLPLLSSYACAIPGILATRSIEHPRQRLITILVAPFQSCSARLPVYSLLILTLMPAAGDWQRAGVLVALYAAGTAGAFGFAWLFHRWLPHGGPEPGFLLELPRYRMPDLVDAARSGLEAGWSFLSKAGTVILALSVLLWALATYPRSDEGTEAEQLEQSAIGRIGHLIEPAVRVLGWDWKTGAAVVTSFAAREVFVGTMSILYEVGDDGSEASDGIDRTPWIERVRGVIAPAEAGESGGEEMLRDRLAGARHADGTPVFTAATCVSLLVFYVYAMQCLATLAVTGRETGRWKWAWFQLGYQTGFALVAAWLAGMVTGWLA